MGGRTIKRSSSAAFISIAPGQRSVQAEEEEFKFNSYFVVQNVFINERWLVLVANEAVGRSLGRGGCGWRRPVLKKVNRGGNVDNDL